MCSCCYENDDFENKHLFLILFLIVYAVTRCSIVFWMLQVLLGFVVLPQN